MIYIRLSGRFGNYLFQIAAGASLAKKHNTDFVVLIAPNDEPLSVDSKLTMEVYLKNLRNSIFKEIPFVKNAPNNIPYYSWRDFPYKEIPYNGKDLIIDGYFQSYKYLDEDYIKELYAIPSEIKSSLCNKYGDIINRPFTCIHVRRGDYLRLPHEFSICSRRYFKDSIKIINKHSQPIICISDDIKWCKKNLNFPNIHFTDKGNSMIEDFYLQTLATDNVISNSSFSWWGAWLNSNKNKRIIYPTPWFGPHHSNYDTSDLCPNTWISLKNYTPLKFKIKSIWIRFRLKFRYFLRTN